MDDHDHEIEARFMERAMELATLGKGYVSPNPLVGCVICYDGRIIGEGWHRKYGESHAEVNAIHAVADKLALSSSTVYVNLEPCSHHGKTPPCVDLLLESGIKKVVIANLDSNPLVSGNGVERLIASGVEVITGVMEKEGRTLNRRFFTFVEKRRPYIILKWAETSDGFMAPEAGSKWISNEFSRLLVHRWRSEEDAVLVGTGTAMQDNPKLNVRGWTGRNPVRIVIDRFTRLDHSLHLFDHSVKTICYNTIKDEVHENLVHVRLDEKDFIGNLVADLAKQQIQSIIVEGGLKTLTLFLEAGLWDEARVFMSRKSFGSGMPGPKFQGKLMEEEFVMNDLLRVYIPHENEKSKHT
jgi:diaminohydroxyphosphoribosylaminopyrimidine deaminase / 5-amino-6-(5-phosphoribosylamino)uracil reductase